MRRLLLVLALATLTLALMAGYLAWRREHHYQRLLAAAEASAVGGDLQQAIESFSGAIAIDPQSMVAWLRRGESYKSRGEWAAALRDLREASRLDPAAPRPHEQLGDVYLAQQNHARASERFEAALALDDRAAGVWYKLGLARYHQGRLDRAVAALRQSAQLDDRRAATRYLLALALSQKGSRNEALIELERTLDLDERFLPAREAMVLLYRDLGRATDALRECLALARIGREDEAIVALARAVSRFPDSPVLLEALGRVWLGVGERDRDRVALSKAVEALRQANDRAPTGEGLALLGRALYRMGDSRQALRSLQAATAILPTTPQAFDWLADAADAQGRPAMARDALVRGATLAGDRGTVQERAARARRIAALSMRTGATAVAVTWLERAVDLAPQDERLKQRLAEARRRTGSPRPASADGSARPPG